MCWPEVVAMLNGLQGVYTKSCCVLCEWESQAILRPLRAETILGQKNVVNRAVVGNTKTYLHPLHIKRGLIKIFVKTMTKEDEGFKYLRQIFSTQKRGQDKTRHFCRSSAAFVMIFASYVNWILLREEPGTRLEAYAATLWEITKSKNYVEIVVELLSTYRALWCDMSLKLHFLQSQLEFFPEKYGTRLWRTRWKVPSGYILHGKKIQRQIEPKFVGWLLLEPGTRYTKEYKTQKITMRICDVIFIYR
jgi:hypothetical protein